MKKSLLLVSLLSVNIFFAHAQIPIAGNVDIKAVIPAKTEFKLLNALDTLLIHASAGNTRISEVGSPDAALSLDMFNTLKGIENNEKEKDPNYYKPQLVNLYPIAANRYMVSIAYLGHDSDAASLRTIVDLIADMNNGQVTFSIPLDYLTRNWKISRIGLITYRYDDTFNRTRAVQFDKNNIRIATTLGLQPEHFDFYLVDNYQDIMPLLGFQYDSESAGNVTEGYGPGDGVIFSIMHNEDFSHDVFHYYAAKIRKHERNSAAEEGVAYSWGNAYYTDDHGEMISQKQLVTKLKAYLLLHPQTSLFDLFSKGPIIFGDQTKVRSLLSSLICDEVERRGGIAAIKELIDCGRGDDNYFKIVNNFIGINAANFDTTVQELLEKY
jgi:hypothetical protein